MRNAENIKEIRIRIKIRRLFCIVKRLFSCIKFIAFVICVEIFGHLRISRILNCIKTIVQDSFRRIRIPINQKIYSWEKALACYYISNIITATWWKISSRLADRANGALGSLIPGSGQEIKNWIVRKVPAVHRLVRLRYCAHRAISSTDTHARTYVPLCRDVDLT